VVVGADTVASNGAVINKIGTSQMALAAREARVPFTVCAESYKFSPMTVFGARVKIEERDPDDIHRLRSLVAAITGSEFWQRAMRSEKRLLEVPFSVKADGLELGRTDKLPVILSGVIDLVFLEPLEEKGDSPLLGWVIADYKTDEILDDLQTYVDYYAPQVRLYSSYWAELTGQPVKETGLFFTYLNRWIPVD